MLSGICQSLRRSPKGTKPTVSFPLETLSSLALPRPPSRLTPPAAWPMILLLKQNPGGDRWSYSQSCSTACSFLYTTASTASSSTATSAACPGPNRWSISSARSWASRWSSKEVLSQRTDDYRNWVEAFARNHQIPIEWAEKGVRKEDYVLPALRRMEKAGRYGVYFIFKSMEQGAYLPHQRAEVSLPRTPTTASWRTSAAASPTTTSTSGMKSWGRSFSAWPPSSPSTPPTGSTATPSSSGN